ncbi:MAG: class I mannose-6-phosphate isomerase [Clostridia bacterium]|nr:class I mannose-6-phosphate isomerase [Clostridia bacterium]
MDGHIYPLKLHPLSKTALWGGNKLRESYGKSSEHEKISETWELSVRAGDTCLIENGSAAGMLLSDYFLDYGKHLIGKGYSGERFPLLVKFIDACDTLSVQVHPDDAYALANEKDPGKTEMWYVVEAEEGSELVYGLRDGVTAEDFKKAVDDGAYESVMRRVKVKAGETYFIPSGMLHAIGAGLLIAEIQQNSDLTYRVYDFDRRGADGKLRPLHVDKAKAVTRPFTEEEIHAVRYSRGVSEDERLLADCSYFRVLRLENGDDLTVTEDSFVHLLCTEGEGYILFEKEKYPFEKGDSYFLPAGLGEVSVVGNSLLLASTPYFDL